MKLEKKKEEGGIALIIVMISILVLGVLAGGFAYSMKVETRLAQNANSESELEWIGRSGVEYARWILAQQAMCPQERFDALTQIWAGGNSGPCATNSGLADVQKEVQLGRGSFTWQITDLERKFNINQLSNPTDPRCAQILEQAFVVMGVDPGESVPYVSAILDWLDTDNNTHIQGAENDYYHGLPVPYDAKNGPIDDLSELLLVKGVTPEMYWGGVSTNHPPAGAFHQKQSRFGGRSEDQGYAVGLFNLFTPISSGRININTASAEVLQLIPGVDPPSAEAIVAGRQGEDDGTGMLGPYRTLDDLRRLPELNPFVVNALRQFGCDVRSATFQVQIDAKVGSYTRQFIAVLGRNLANPRDVQVLNFYWK